MGEWHLNTLVRFLCAGLPSCYQGFSLSGTRDRASNPMFHEPYSMSHVPRYARNPHSTKEV
jgi:hypothetical protein